MLLRITGATIARNIYAPYSSVKGNRLPSSYTARFTFATRSIATSTNTELMFVSLSTRKIPNRNNFKIINIGNCNRARSQCNCESFSRTKDAQTGPILQCAIVPQKTISKIRPPQCGQVVIAFTQTWLFVHPSNTRTRTETPHRAPKVARKVPTTTAHLRTVSWVHAAVMQILSNCATSSIGGHAYLFFDASQSPAHSKTRLCPRRDRT